MEVQHERNSDGLSTIVAEIPVETVNEVYQAALKELKRHAHVPGFRPGKVPPKLVESIIGREAIEGLAKERLADRVMPEVVKALPQLVTLDDPDVELDDFAKGQPSKITIKSLTAVVELADPATLEVEQFRADVSDEEAEAELRRYHHSQAEVSPADHDDVRAGDRVTFALRILRDGYLVEEYPADDPLGIVIGDNRLDPNIDEHLVGLSVEQQATFAVTYPDDHGNEELRGATAEFAVQILEVGTQETLEAFVTRIGLGESVDEAKATIANSIGGQRTSYFRVIAREAAVEKMVEASTIDIPRYHLEAVIMEELEELEEDLEERGVDVDGADHEDVEAQKERTAAQAEFDLKRDVLLQAISQVHEVQVEVEDISREVSMISNYNRISPDLLLRRLDESGELRQVVRNARLRKAAEFVLSHAQVTLVDPPEQDEDEDGHVHGEHCDHGPDHEHAAAEPAEEASIVDDPVEVDEPAEAEATVESAPADGEAEAADLDQDEPAEDA